MDVDAFESAAATARRSRDPAVYRAALDLYAGELLPEDRYEAWAEERCQALRQTYLSLLVEIAGVHEKRGEYEPGVEVLRRVVAEEPSHEVAHAGLMRLFSLCEGRGEAILQYERLRKVLSREFDVEPGPAVRRLYEEVRAGTLPAAPTSSVGHRSEEPIGSSPHNLPTSLTSFVGREHETLEDTLADHLGSRDLLLVLDNWEHLVGGVARLAGALLGARPNLKILATSREPLGVPGEAVWTVPPLSLPDAHGTPTVEDLTRCEAVRLCVDRARSRLPAFELTPENVASTASVCRRLDGIPLAIELATARLGLRLAAALGRFWGIRGSSEGREWLEKGLARSGTAPMKVNSSTKVENLNADQLDGQDSSQFVPTNTNSFIRNSTYRNESALGPGTQLGNGTHVLAASCLAGDRMLSGGPANLSGTTDMVESFPSSTTSWSARVDKNGQTDNYSVVVLCANQ